MGDAADIYYDNSRKKIFISCGEGYIEVIDQINPNEYKLEEILRTVHGARTSLYVKKQKHFYLAVPKTGKRDAQIRIYKVQ